jgi:hypothetical protein
MYISQPGEHVHMANNSIVWSLLLFLTCTGLLEAGRVVLSRDHLCMWQKHVLNVDGVLGQIAVSGVVQRA